MTSSLTSRISFFVLIALIVGGFPNYVIQEAFAASATVSTIHTGDTAGNAPTTTIIDVVFNQKIFVNTGGANGTSVDKQLLSDVGGAGAGEGIASAIVRVSVAGSDDTDCTNAAAIATVISTLDVALATGAVPTVAFGNDGLVLTCDGEDALVANFTATAATDGLRPVFSSAATTGPTTIDVVFSESMVGGEAW